MAVQQEVGRRGEDVAVDVLKKKGHVILHRNWRCRHLEVDLISRDGEYLVFTEVKCRTDNTLQEPFKAVDVAKQHKLIRAANAYIRRYKSDLEVRFDVVSVVLGPPVQVTHIEHAFYPTLR